MIEAGHLDRRVQFLRAAMVDDGLQARPGAFRPLGGPVWAGKRPVSDGERFRAGQVRFDVTDRFTVRHSALTAGLRTSDRLTCEGRTYAVTGIKEIGRREGFEITASEVRA